MRNKRKRFNQHTQISNENTRKMTKKGKVEIEDIARDLKRNEEKPMILPCRDSNEIIKDSVRQK